MNTPSTPSTPHTPPTSSDRTPAPVGTRSPASIGLSLLACALGAACLVRVLSLTTSPAAAEMVTSIPGELTVLTADAGSEDVLLLLDNRSERLMVYKTTQNGLQLFASQGLRELFTRARLTSPQ